MMSQIPINLEKIAKKDLDREILRAGVIAELDAINLYEQMAGHGGHIFHFLPLLIAKELN